MDKLYIVMPAYNEQDAILAVVEEWHAVVEKVSNNSRLLIINDGSKDETLNRLLSLKDKYPLLEVKDKANSGHGPTCLYGYNYALSQGADFVFQTDSDRQTSARDFWGFWENREKFNFIFGFRNHRGDGLIRWLISKTLRVVVLFIFGVFIKDSNVPFRLMKAQALRKYVEKVPKDFFLANVLIAVLIIKAKESLVWKNIEFKERPSGESISLKKIFSLGLKLISDLYNYKKNGLKAEHKERAAYE